MMIRLQNPINLVISDIDGTVITPHEALVSRTITAAQNLQKWKGYSLHICRH